MKQASADHEASLDCELGEEMLSGEATVANLWSVCTIQEAVGKFGYAPGDRIPRRDQIKIFERVHEAISAKKLELVADGRYEEVVRLQETLCKLKEQFQKLQLTDVDKDQAKQRALYNKAREKCMGECARTIHSAGARVEEICAAREAELEQLHRAQRETLELELSWLPQPRIKYTNRFLELQKTKAGLVRLHQYHDAHTVHKALSKLQPLEEKAFLAEYHAQIALKRQALEKRQAQDRTKLQESLTDLRLREERERFKVTENVRSKLKHSERSMRHAHIMSLKRRPELAQNPSAHWQRRSNFSSSAAALRGEQLARAIKGKVSGSAIKVADLTSIHDFGSVLSGTMQGIGEIRRTSTPSRESQDRVQWLSSLEKDLAQALARPFADQLEAWKDTSRVSSGANVNNDANKNATRHRNAISRGDPVVYTGGNGSGGGENRDTGSNSSSSGDINHKNTVRAWNSGSLLVRAGGEAPTGRVPRMTYIYLVGNARAGDGVEVEVLVGDEKARTVLSNSSGVTCARVPAREFYTVKHLSGDGKTAVLFWTSPSGESGELVSTEGPDNTT
eukprot:g9815.t2